MQEQRTVPQNYWGAGACSGSWEKWLEGVVRAECPHQRTMGEELGLSHPEAPAEVRVGGSMSLTAGEHPLPQIAHFTARVGRAG